MILVDIEKTLYGSKGTFKLEVSFEIHEKEFLALFGNSGVGKTTILRIIAGLEKPDRGIVKIGDSIYFDSYKNINLPPQKRKVGFVFQNYALFPNMTVYENIAYVMDKEDKGKIYSLLEMFEIDGLKDRYPITLSGGQKQRVAFARALARQPEILLLDEPLSALDYNLRLNLQNELKNIHENYGLTTLLVSHDKAEIFKLADRVIFIENGKISKQGSPREVFIEKDISGKFSLYGIVLDIKKDEGINILTVDVCGNLIEVVCSQEFSIGDEVLVSSKAFNPIIRKIKK